MIGHRRSRAHVEAQGGPWRGPEWVYCGMSSRGWQVWVIAGALLILVGGLLILDTALAIRRHGQPLQVLSVDEATARVDAGEFLAHVRLTDLIGLCRERHLAGGRYGDGIGAAGTAGPHVLIVLRPDEQCTDDSDAPLPHLAGSLERASAALLAEPGIVREAPTRVAVFRQRGPEPGAPFVPAALVLLGSVLVVVGLRRRRSPGMPDDGSM